MSNELAKDLFKSVTDRMVKMIEESGELPWRKPWHSTGLQLPRNWKTGRRYNGINVLTLMLTAQESGYTSPYWMTFNQARKAKGKVRKGEKGQRVVFWKFLRKTKTDDAGNETEDRIPMLRYFTVFNEDQIDGLTKRKGPVPGEEAPKLDPSVRSPAADTVMRLYFESDDGPRRTEGASPNGAWYRPSTDTVNLPKYESFKSAAEYHSTEFHEAIHSTGSATRLNRAEMDEGAFHVFGSENYSREELTAELGAAFLCAGLGLDCPQTESNSAAYLKGWLKRLKDDPRALVVAAGKATKAVDYILDTAGVALSVEDVRAEDESDGE